MADVLDGCFQRILLHHTAIRFRASCPYLTLNYSSNSSFILFIIYAEAGGMR